MPLRRWKKIAEETLFENPWWTYKRDRFELPSGKRGEYHYAETRGSAMTVAVDGDGRIVMVNQYRYLHDRESLEFPCGSVKAGHTHEETATHELAEEAGVGAGTLVAVGEFNPYNGVAKEICRVFVATGLVDVDAEPDETEEFEVLRLSVDEIEARIADGTIWDGMSIAAWGIARRHVVR